MPELTTLESAVARHVRAGDTVQVLMGHSRWTAAARELVRQRWGSEEGLTLVMASLGSLGALFVRGRMVDRIVTSYSGDSFPTYSPNPIFQAAYQSGQVEVEHWSFLTLAQRLEAAARGLPAAVTGSLLDSSMAENPAYRRVDSPFGPLGLLEPLVPDVTLLHAAAADGQGNLALSEPLFDGLFGAWAARRGVVATVERVVEDLDGLGHRVRLPGHRVLAVVEAPFGAHPGGCFAPGLPVRSYGEDVPFWIDAAAAARADFDDWARHWALEPSDQEAYLAALGADRLEGLAQRADPRSWREDAEAHPVPTKEPVSPWETAAALAAREVEARVAEHRADAVLAGAGVANLAAWVAVARMEAAGRPVRLTAELGMWGYHPTPADPYIFNQRSFPSTAFLSDASTVLGLVVGGPGTRVVGCLGAAEVDAAGDINSTQLAGDRFLVGSGGGNDVASRAAACVVVTLAQPRRLPERAAYVTSPGRAVESVVTDLGVLRRLDGELRIAAVPAGPGPLEARVKALSEACGYDPAVARQLEELAPVDQREVLALREYDRERVFLR